MSALLLRVSGFGLRIIDATCGAGNITDGESAFEFRVIERCAPEDCVSREQFWIDYFETFDRHKGYNMSPTAGSLRGMKRKPLSAESRKKIGDAHRGKKRGPMPLAHKERLRLIAKTRKRFPHTEETKLKMSLARKGKLKSEETKRNSFRIKARMP